MAPPLKQSSVRIIWGKGFDLATETIDLALQSKILIKENNTTFYKGEKIATSRPKLEKYFIDNPMILKEIADILRKTVKDVITIEEDSDSQILEDAETIETEITENEFTS